MDITTEISTTYYDIDPSSSYNNYVLTRTYTDANGSDYRINIDYFDGLGRPSGSVLVAASPLCKDIVTRQDYDSFGRKIQEWLPRVSEYSNGKYIPSLEFERLSTDIYNNDTHAYSRTVYENSPLNRVLEQYGPGQKWQEGGHSMKSSYMTNLSGVDTLNCVYYTATNVGDTIIQINRIRNYASGQLFVTRVENEDGNASFEFKDKLGRVLLTRQIKHTGMVKELYDTYYITDNYGNQVAVLPPELADVLHSGTSFRLSSSDAALRDYAYLYQYDSRNRCIGKKLPGCEWILYVYDRADRLILSQDGNQRKYGQWSFSIPDNFDRVVLMGVCNNQLDYSTEPLASSIVKASRNNTTDSNKGYSVTGLNLNTLQVLNVNYYDNYDFTGKNSIPDSTDLRAGYDEEYKAEGYGERYTVSAKGLLTGTLIAQLGGSSSKPTYLYSVMYYDNRGRLIQAKSNNQLPDGTDKEYFAYNFTGQPVKRKHVHSVGSTVRTELYTYTYDHAGRLLTTTHELNDGGKIKLIDNMYDELGRLK